MSKVDDLIIQAIQEDGHLKPGEFITEAIVMYATVEPDKPGFHRYGKIFLGTTMPSHHAIGLIDMVKESIYDFSFVDEDDED